MKSNIRREPRCQNKVTRSCKTYIHRYIDTQIRRQIGQIRQIRQIGQIRQIRQIDRSIDRQIDRQIDRSIGGIDRIDRIDGDLELRFYVDADFAGDRLSGKSTSGGYLVLHGPNSFFPLGLVSAKLLHHVQQLSRKWCRWLTPFTKRAYQLLTAHCDA